YNAIIAAFETGDQRRVVELQNLSVDIIREFQKYGFLAASKEVMKLVGIDCGAVRSPVIPLQAGELDEIASSLESLGAMQWI
ncbi:MAG: dihydrodipicolinate synthetase, partial [Planctomycetaceae bacterium]|nr:dihydrodipicolinate synthetase [Planctomycetaceae bacterium]